MDGILVTPLVIRVQDKVEQASQRSILASILITNRVHDLSIIEKARAARKDPKGNKIIQKFGEIYRREARKQIEEDNTNELKVVNMRQQCLQKPWKVKYKKVINELKFLDRFFIPGNAMEYNI
jgi:hypothetical protein